MRWQGKLFCLLTAVLCFLTHYTAAQNQRVADSLARIYRKGVPDDTTKLELLRNLSFNEVNDLNLALRYAEELISLAQQLNNPLYLYRGYLQKGNKKRLMGDIDEALDAYIKGVEAAQKANYPVGEGTAYGTIADLYTVAGNHANSLNYYRKAIATLRQTSDTVALASIILNAGDGFLQSRVYDSALLHFKEAAAIFNRVQHEPGKAYCLGNMGMVYANTGSNSLAEDYMNKAIGILERTGDYYPICVYLLSMADIYLGKSEERTARLYAHRSLALARKYGLKDQVSKATLKLSQLYERSGNHQESLRFYKEHVAYRDSVNDINTVQKMADLRTAYEVAQKQGEVDLLNKEREKQEVVTLSLSVILILATLILGTLYWYYRTISREKQRSEGLLLNILPAETAKELKQSGKVDAVKVDKVTVMFTDFVEFSRQAELVDPEQLVKSIDFYFKGFDAIVTRWGLEKIKTIGDSYMCVCGLHTPHQVHARNVIHAAQDMIDLVNRELGARDGLSHFQVRIGIHTGPVVAGIVGTKKWQYDIWGDTVNIASRMESMSQPGRVNLSETTYQEIRNEFPCEYRGEMEAKNRGSLKMYFLGEAEPTGKEKVQVVGQKLQPESEQLQVADSK